jgi:hypothetical protein
MAKGKKRKAAPGDVATNRQASFRYNLLERFEAGIVLTGTEVKSLRDGKAQIKDAYAMVRDGEVWLFGLYIPPYGPASRENHDRARGPRSRSRWPRARTCSTSATRSATATSPATCSVSFARSAGERFSAPPKPGSVRT